jgi:hypothetical protein
MSTDPKWLELLKASGWQTAALSLAGIALLYLNAGKRLPVALDSWVVESVEVAVLVCGSLAVFSVGPHLLKLLNHLWIRLGKWWAIREEKNQVEKDILTMTVKEREIIGYLLANNQNMFNYTIDGGAANTLI